MTNETECLGVQEHVLEEHGYCTRCGKPDEVRLASEGIYPIRHWTIAIPGCNCQGCRSVRELDAKKTEILHNRRRELINKEKPSRNGLRIVT